MYFRNIAVSKSFGHTSSPYSSGWVTPPILVMKSRKSRIRDCLLCSCVYMLHFIWLGLSWVSNMQQWGVTWKKSCWMKFYGRFNPPSSQGSWSFRSNALVHPSECFHLLPGAMMLVVIILRGISRKVGALAWEVGLLASPFSVMFYCFWNDLCMEYLEVM